MTSKKAAGRAAPPPPAERRRTTRPPKSGAFPIVGIGASAGGLEAFRRLLGALPDDTGMAYVLVQHLDPSHESILAELLSESTSMDVAEIKGDVRVEPNRVYVIPPSKGLILEDGTLKLVPRGPPGASHMPIDSFLTTLANVQGGQAIGVILSGMGADGTLGLRAIEAEGGIAFVQEPNSAQNEDMPRSAISSGHADFVLTPEGIAHELARLGKHPYLAVGSAAPAVPGGAANPKSQAAPSDREDLNRVLEVLRQKSGTDFSAYKKTTLKRRIARRMAVSRVETLQQYALYLQDDAKEAGALYEDCLISVTSFFRDPQVFEALSEQVLPRLLSDRAADAPLRIWVPGCATGEEVYSIAMCLLERAAELSHNPSLQIFATDLSEGALAKAREGAYPASIIRDVSPERLRRFFSKVSDGYRINKTIREACVFARRDLTRDPPYSRIDLVSCRNLLIYLEPHLQEMVFATLHYALRPEGFLLVGPAEAVGGSSSLFNAFDEKHRIYSRRAAGATPRLLAAPRDSSPSALAATALNAKPPAASEVPRETDRILLARFGPPSVVVDEGLRVLEFRGDTTPFLDHGGKASLSLERLLRKGLLIDLRHAVEETRRTDAPTRREGLRVHYQQEIRSVALEVIPIKGRAAAEHCLLILFEAKPIPPHGEASAPVAPGDDAGERDRELVRLSQLLSRTNEYLHTLVSEHESALEELQSTTEEALSGNEELQSLNEELQTAKEEIQSANEELATLNQELQDRNALLARSNDDIQHGLDRANALVDTVAQPLVILDHELCIEKANAAFYGAFRTTAEQTRGQPLRGLGGGRWGHPPVLAALSGVLQSGTTLAAFEFEADFPELGPRTLSLNAQRLPAEYRGNVRLLLAIEDRTELKRAERGRDALFALEQGAREQAEAADRLKDHFVATVSHELRGPLMVISSWMNVLSALGTTPDPATLAKALAAIGRAVSAQSRLISDLLDHSRIVTGKVELQRVPIDLRTVAEAALVGVRAAAQAKDIDLQISGERGPCVVLGDADRMQQVLWNLFLNAVKFTPPRGQVRVTLRRVDNQAEIAVRDTGCGIPADFLPQVFARFRQAEGSSSRAQQGLGLGLTLVQELVELHGGTVRAESAGKDQGATFTVLLPISALELAAIEIAGAEASTLEVPDENGPPSTIPPASMRTNPPLALPRNTLDGTRVLVVDDEADARDALVNLLQRYGAEVRSAASVVEAMSALALEVPDILISDLGMPGDDGYELIRRVRLLPAEAGGRLPSLAISAYATNEHRDKVLRTGFQKYLEKPVAPSDLVSEVVRLTSKSTAHVAP